MQQSHLGCPIFSSLSRAHGGWLRGRRHWGSTSGERAKFGLRASEIVAVVDVLTAAGMLDCLELLHFHAGSQARLSVTTSISVRTFFHYERKSTSCNEQRVPFFM